MTRCLLLLPLAVPLAIAHAQSRQPLSAADIDDIAKLEMLEDRRQFDSTELSRLLTSPHPEVRRRAALATGRINDKRGLALLLARPLDVDTAVAATEVFAVGHLRDPSTVAWFDSLLSSAQTPPTLLVEAACALGKIATPASREVLIRFLERNEASPRTADAIEEALLSVGRSPRGDITPLLRWTRSTDDEIKWRATWALFRPRDPASVAPLLVLAKDKSPLVRSWALRGLSKPEADSARLGAEAEALLIDATKDKDRRVATEALNALGTYADSAAIPVLISSLVSTDSWLAVSAATGLGRARTPQSVAALVATTSAGRPCAVRVVAMQSLQQVAPTEVARAASDIGRDSVPYCRTTAYTTIARLAAAESAGTPMRIDLDARLQRLRDDRRFELHSNNASVQVPAIRAAATWGDSADLATMREVLAHAQRDSMRAVSSAATATIAQIERRLSGQPQGRGGGGGGGRGGGGARTAPPAPIRPIEDYKAIVERWVVPAYNGAVPQVVRWETTRGPIELELYPGDAPLAVDDLIKTMQSGVIAGTEFTRVVPDFVDQQQSIQPGNTLRDEVNRHRLTRANLSWATAGLDTGTPGYTLNHTPQPHNEGNFTSMGRVVRGIDVVDRIELGDRVVGGRMLRSTVR